MTSGNSATGDEPSAPASGTVAWRQLLGEAEARLTGAGIEEPRVSARRIVEECSGADGAELALVLDEPVTQRQMAAFDRRIERRLEGEPIQYVVGRWGFRTLDLFVDRRVLIPRPETEIVAGSAIDEVRRVAALGGATTVVDLGCGSGALGLSIAAEVDEVDVWLTDVSDDALAVARANLAGLGLRAARTRIAAGSWFEALPAELRGGVGVMVSNPPYIAASEGLEPSVAEWEPELALVAGPSGLESLEHLVDHATEWLIPEGALVLEMSPWQIETIVSRAEAVFSEIDVVADLAGHDRAIVARRPG